MTTPRECLLYATAEPVGRWGIDSDVVYTHAHLHAATVALYYSRHPTVRIHVREASFNESTPYWAWWANDATEFRYLWPSRVLVECCFGDAFAMKRYEERGEGQLLRVVVTPV